MQQQDTKDGKFALDEWTKIYPTPTAAPFELKLTGSTFRGMGDKQAAIDYATEVSAFFAKNDLDMPVFVVRGPTSTTRNKFEVVTSTAGYSVVFKVNLTVQMRESMAQILREQRDALLTAMEGLLENQVAAWKASGFDDAQIRAMPYLKPSFEAVMLAKS